MVGIAQYFAAQRDNVRTGTHDSAAICVQLTRSNVSNHLACLRDCESGSTGDASVGLLRGDPKLPGYTAPRPGTARLAVPGRGRRGHADTGRTRRHGHLRPTHSPGRRAPPDAVALSAHHDGGLFARSATDLRDRHIPAATIWMAIASVHDYAALNHTSTICTGHFHKFRLSQDYWDIERHAHSVGGTPPWALRPMAAAVPPPGKSVERCHQPLRGTGSLPGQADQAAPIRGAHAYSV